MRRILQNMAEVVVVCPPHQLICAFQDAESSISLLPLQEETLVPEETTSVLVTTTARKQGASAMNMFTRTHKLIWPALTDVRPRRVLADIGGRSKRWWLALPIGSLGCAPGESLPNCTPTRVQQFAAQTRKQDNAARCSDWTEPVLILAGRDWSGRLGLERNYVRTLRCWSCVPGAESMQMVSNEEPLAPRKQAGK